MARNESERTITKELRIVMSCYNDIWKMRGQIDKEWPTPGWVDSIKFAFTESGEVMDAHMRIMGGYSRNNAKSMNLFDELADLVMMLLTALGSGVRDGEVISGDFLLMEEDIPDGAFVITVCTMTSKLLLEEPNSQNGLYYILAICVLIASFFEARGHDLYDTLRGRLNRIRIRVSEEV